MCNYNRNNGMVTRLPVRGVSIGRPIHELHPYDGVYAEQHMQK